MTTTRRRYHLRRIVMTCDRCGYQRAQCQRGACPQCREGLMIHENDGPMRVYVEEVERGTDHATPKE